MIILERDGSLHHYPPGHTDEGWRRATIEIQDAQAQPTIIERILDFTFDVLGISNLEMRIHEHSKR